MCVTDAEKMDTLMLKKWTHWDLNPGPSACEADVIPLHHVPLLIASTWCDRLCCEIEDGPVGEKCSESHEPWAWRQAGGLPYFTHQDTLAERSKALA
jgi:hypothetical protein